MLASSMRGLRASGSWRASITSVGHSENSFTTVPNLKSQPYDATRMAIDQTARQNMRSRTLGPLFDAVLGFHAFHLLDASRPISGNRPDQVILPIDRSINQFLQNNRSSLHSSMHVQQLGFHMIVRRVHTRPSRRGNPDVRDVAIRLRVDGQSISVAKPFTYVRILPSYHIHTSTIH